MVKKKDRGERTTKLNEIVRSGRPCKHKNQSRLEKTIEMKIWGWQNSLNMQTLVVEVHMRYWYGLWPNVGFQRHDLRIHFQFRRKMLDWGPWTLDSVYRFCRRWLWTKWHIIHNSMNIVNSRVGSAIAVRSQHGNCGKISQEFYDIP